MYSNLHCMMSNMTLFLCNCIMPDYLPPLPTPPSFFFLSNILEVLIELPFARLFSFIVNFYNSLYFVSAVFLLFTFFPLSSFLNVQAKTFFKRNNGNWENSNAALCCFFILHGGIPTLFSPTNSCKISDDCNIIDDDVFTHYVLYVVKKRCKDKAILYLLSLISLSCKRHTVIFRSFSQKICRKWVDYGRKKNLLTLSLFYSLG